MPNTTKKYKRTYKDKVKIKEKSSQRLQTDFQTRLGLKKKKPQPAQVFKKIQISLIWLELTLVSGNSQCE